MASGDIDALADALSRAITTRISQHGNDKERVFASGEFFDYWFREHGSASFFIFKEPSSVTNLQYAELMSLIYRYHTSPPDVSISLSTVQVFNELITRIVTSFLSLDSAEEIGHRCSALYGDIVRSIVVVDLLSSSCAVYTPPGVSLRIKQICAFAGYIEFGGNNILIRNTSRVTAKFIFERLESHLGAAGGQKHASLVVYNHEDFRGYKQAQAVKLYVDKFYVQTEPLVKVLQRLRTDFADRLNVVTNMVELKRSSSSAGPTYWLIHDRSLLPTVGNPSDNQFLICYEQAFHNKNCLHVFDENKPAWYDHTTIAHTLVGAMINITRPWWPKGRPIVVADFFCGTGTTTLEVSKYSEVQFIGIDKLEIADILMDDNLAFFKYGKDDLDQIISSLKALPKIMARHGAPNIGTGTNASEPRREPYVWAKKFLETVWDREQIRRLGEEQLQEFREATFLERLIVYILLRGIRRHELALTRDRENLAESIGSELGVLLNQIRKHRIDRATNRVEDADGIGVLQGTYSQSCVCSINEIDRRVICGKGILEIDMPPDQCDVIVTDPPYGLNAEIDRVRLAELYSNVIPKMVRTLRPGGQLVMALPDWSHTGRQVPFFLLHEFVLRQARSAAGRLGRHVVLPRLLPDQLEAVPYFWESSRALRRSILHVQFVQGGLH